MESYRSLLVWQKAVDFAVLIYQLTAAFPKHEVYGIVSQMQRAVVSIPSNIAEGKERQSDRDFARFLAIALGSLAELETQLLIAQRLGYLDEFDWQEATAQADEIGKMLRSLHKKLNNSN
ncbi:MAG: four helix bundle protein [Gammaproteobacteria bacterium]|nr:four helix bundle protein [Gammaproteobacteria bacterium]MBU1775218.1 four helix bundle protein [Gammaproteobacteria bacterium]MBU1968556.1 four helix bundle protein [Gammaproteobacteria bacterium]